MKDRLTARRLCSEHLAANDALGWFELLYSRHDAAVVPWADLVANPNLVTWLKADNPHIPRGNALKVGCGLGDDAEFIQSAGFDTVAFDISPSAIGWCCERFPGSHVSYRVADLFAAPAEWTHAFGFVQESYTLQVLPPDRRVAAISRIAEFVGSHGYLLVISRAREAGDMPWPLTEPEVRSFTQHGLELISLEDFVDRETPPVRRFRALFRRI